MMRIGSLRGLVGLLVGGAFLGASLATPGLEGVALAEEATPTGKGIAGGALLGGELVMTIEAAAGVDRPLYFSIGGIGGAIAGGVGGYFVEQSVSSADIPVYMLGAGMALLIPAAILAMNATAYKPPPEYQEDKGASGAEPVADAPQPSSPPPPQPAQPPPPSGGGAGTPPAQGPLSWAPRMRPAGSRRYSYRSQSVAPPRLSVPTSVVEWQGAGVRMGLPAVEVRPVFSQQDLRQYGMSQREEVRIPVFRASF